MVVLVVVVDLGHRVWVPNLVVVALGLVRIAVGVVVVLVHPEEVVAIVVAAVVFEPVSVAQIDYRIDVIVVVEHVLHSVVVVAAVVVAIATVVHLTVEVEIGPNLNLHYSK